MVSFVGGRPDSTIFLVFLDLSDSKTIQTNAKILIHLILTALL
ncbi:hypothetical protein NUH30_09930 [Leptospira sp. 85282-16]|nr:hypothetical protein [Leptospira sp. 85282-16]